jgi:HAD superfamily hydrolase (TIGR01459 family)
MQILDSIAPLAETADVWFLDIWGVLHNGKQPHANAVDAGIAFREKGGSVILVSNSPRPRAGVIRQLNDIGVDHAAYDDVVTSGDVSRALIKAQAPGPMLHIGPGRDAPLFDALDVDLASAADAKVAVCSGLYDDEIETPADYALLLEILVRRDMPMICANPDVKVERGGKIIYCAGAIAQLYEKMGGRVSYAGKPYPPIYESALALAGSLRNEEIDSSKILAIGDGAATDIRGASQAGIRSVFIASRIHVDADEDLDAAAAKLFSDLDLKPVALMPALVW